jgi:Toxin SymE, type I toxin-antitoxin system
MYEYAFAIRTFPANRKSTFNPVLEVKRDHYIESLQMPFALPPATDNQRDQNRPGISQKGARPFSFMQTRKLKIEEEGDRWRGIKPKIRIMGKWLERAGFKPGQHVHISCVAQGVIEMRFVEKSITP